MFHNALLRLLRCVTVRQQVIGDILNNRSAGLVFVTQFVDTQFLQREVAARGRDASQFIGHLLGGQAQAIVVQVRVIWVGVIWVGYVVGVALLGIGQVQCQGQLRLHVLD